jgi:hypothetical protein
LTTSRLHQILERLRAHEFPDLREEFVQQVAEIEERNVFDDDRTGAVKELRSLLAIEIQSARVNESESE